jgi:hypothetical protein
MEQPSTVSDSGKTSLRSYLGGAPGAGCASGCMVHLVLLGVLGLLVLIWAIRNRAWELEVTVELPAEKEPGPKADMQE